MDDGFLPVAGAVVFLLYFCTYRQITVNINRKQFDLKQPTPAK